jgi:hypothetical protein
VIRHFVATLERMSEVSSIYAHCKCEVQYGNILLLSFSFTAKASGRSMFHLGTTSPLFNVGGREREGSTSFVVSTFLERKM